MVIVLSNFSSLFDLLFGRRAWRAQFHPVGI